MRNDKRQIKRCGFLLLFAALLSGMMTACALSPKKTRYQAEFLDLFDTVTQIVGYAGTEEEFTRQAEFIRGKLQEYHQLFDIYNDYEGIPNIKTINDNAGISPVRVDPRIIGLLKFGREMYEETGGTMNIAFGSVLSVWHDYRIAGIDDPEHAALPPMDRLKAAALHTDISKVLIDEENSTVFLEDPRMRLDVGAVAKGYAAEEVGKLAASQGMDNLLLSVGGNVKAIGKKNGTAPWRVAVQNPDPENGGRYLFNMLLEDKSLVSSGDYQRYYTVDGKRYHHIIDPVTLMPSEYYAAVSIVCRDSGMADALSTAVYNMPFDEGLALIEALPETEALWVYRDGTQAFSSGFESMKEKQARD